MLPMFDHKKTVSLIMQKRKGETGFTSEPNEIQAPNSHEGLEAAAEDLIAAVESKDKRAVAAALKSAFEICDASPHDEGPHTNGDE